MNAGEDWTVSVSQTRATTGVRESGIEFHAVTIGAAFFNEGNRHSVNVRRSLSDTAAERALFRPFEW